MSKPSAQQLIELGISRTHAYDILGEREEPSLGIALKIYDAFGERFGLLKGKTEEFIAELRREAA